MIYVNQGTKEKDQDSPPAPLKCSIEKGLAAFSNYFSQTPTLPQVTLLAVFFILFIKYFMESLNILHKIAFYCKGFSPELQTRIERVRKTTNVADARDQWLGR